MKANRKSLIFAFCAMASVVGLAGCSDDSSSSSKDDSFLTVNPKSVELGLGGSEQVRVDHSNDAVVAVKSNDEKCVKVNISNQTTKVTLFDIQAVSTTGCNTTVAVSDDYGNLETVSAKVDVAREVFKTDKSTLNVKSGETADVVVTHTQGGQVVEEEIVASIDDTQCAKIDYIDPDTNIPGSNGELTITVKGVSEETCEAKLTVKSGSNEKVVTINVSKDGSAVVSSDVILEFYDLQPKEGPVKIKLNDENNRSDLNIRAIDSATKQNASGVTVTFASSDEQCVSLVSGKKKTGNDGLVKNSVSIRNPLGCKADITISSDKSDKTLVASVEVEEMTEYDMDVSVNADPLKAGKITYVRGAYLEGETSCKTFTNDPSIIPEEIDDNSNYADATTEMRSDGDPLASLTFIEVPTEGGEGDGVVIVYGAGSEDPKADVLAYGCKEIKGMASSVAVDLTIVSPEIEGTYNVTTNIDLTSGFSCTKNAQGDCELPAVEDMVAGDWVHFTVDFVKTPLDTLIDFVWVNSVSRLHDISTDQSWLKTIIDFVDNPATKAIAVAALKNYLGEYLESQNWYKIFGQISGDVGDLASNMQLVGELNVDTASNGKITKASVKYNELQYQWSYGTDTTLCRSPRDYYISPATNGKVTYEGAKYVCRKPLALDKKASSNSTINGDWTGNIATYEGQDVLNINDFSVDFKWATILYVAVFGTILPEALNYANDPDVEAGRYVKSFLNKLLFQTVIAAYEKKLEGGKEGVGTCAGKDNKWVEVETVDENGTATKKCMPKLTIAKTTTDEKGCERFIEALAYMVYTDAAKVSGVIAGAATVACGDMGFGQLEKLVTDSLNKVQAATTDDMLNMGAKNCPLFDESTRDYMLVGKPDEKVYSANDIINKKLDTRRCELGINAIYGEGKDQSKIHLTGFFHAKKSKDKDGKPMTH